jgi:ribosome-associated protein
VSTDSLRIAPQRGLPLGLTIPGDELDERFSRSSGPGGQGVNTTDSRVELSWSVTESTALSDQQRQTLLSRLSSRLIDGALVIAASEHRSQLRNRLAARERLAMMIADALTPTTPRRPTRPSRRAKQTRLDDKRHRGEIKTKRGRVRDEP